METRLRFLEALEEGSEFESELSLLSEVSEEVLVYLSRFRFLTLFERDKAAFFLGRVVFSLLLVHGVSCSRRKDSRSFWDVRISFIIEWLFSNSFESCFAKVPSTPVPGVENEPGAHGERVNHLYVSRLSTGRGMSVRWAGISNGLFVEKIAPPLKVKFVFCSQYCVFQFIFVAERAGDSNVSHY